MKRFSGYITGGFSFSLIACLAFAAGVYATEEPAVSSPASSVRAYVPSGDLPLIARIRGLSELQQRVVNGDRSALSEQLAVARSIAQEFARRPASSERSPSELRSVIKYVLSGGDPTVLDRLISPASVPQAELSLARGVVAYSRGDRSQSANLLNSVDHHSLEPSLAGHVALVKAVIASHSSAEDARNLCREAMLLSPGTHIEEAALRLLISIAAASGDAAGAEKAHSSHLLRFPDSLYSSDIDARVAGILAANLDPDAAEIKVMADLPQIILPTRRRAFYARLAEAGLRSGKPVIAIRAARLALLPPTSPPASDTEMTASLLAIEGAALVLTTDRKAGLRKLAEAHVAGPNAEFADLIVAAEGLVSMIEAPPAQPAGKEHGAIVLSVPPTTDGASAKIGLRDSRMAQYDAVLGRGEAALAAADQLIEQAAK